MCLIIYQPPGSKAITRDVIVNGWDSNDDGAGYMFVTNGKLIIRKPFYKRKKLIAAYERDHNQYGATSPFVMHFRWATHGDHSAVNIHPHLIPSWYEGEEIALVHNGILTIPEHEKGMSDTASFVHTILAYRPADQLLDEDFGTWLGNMIGYGNKFVMMDNTGRVSIVNEEMGEWDGEYWYSNDGYKAYSGYAMYKYRRQLTGTEPIVRPTDSVVSAATTSWGKPDEWDDARVDLDTLDEQAWKEEAEKYRAQDREFELAMMKDGNSLSC